MNSVRIQPVNGNYTITNSQSGNSRFLTPSEISVLNSILKSVAQSAGYNEFSYNRIDMTVSHNNPNTYYVQMLLYGSPDVRAGEALDVKFNTTDASLMNLYQSV
jgi:hypothetical protein